MSSLPDGLCIILPNNIITTIVTMINTIIITTITIINVWVVSPRTLGSVMACLEHSEEFDMVVS